MVLYKPNQGWAKPEFLWVSYCNKEIWWNIYLKCLINAEVIQGMTKITLIFQGIGCLTDGLNNKLTKVDQIQWGSENRTFEIRTFWRSVAECHLKTGHFVRLLNGTVSLDSFMYEEIFYLYIKWSSLATIRKPDILVWFLNGC